MKKKFSRILGVGLTLALLTSLVFSVPVSANVTQATVSLSDADISASSEYVVTFAVNTLLTGGTDDILIEFPTGTDISPIGDAADDDTDTDTSSDPQDDVWVGATSGIGTSAFGFTSSASAEVGQVLEVRVPANIGPGALVQVIVGVSSPTQGSGGKIGNPGTPGDYTLDVSTDAETTVVTSATYELGAPTIVGLPGITNVYNDTGILMAQYTGDYAIRNAIAAAGVDYVIKVGPGTYVEAGPADNFDTTYGEVSAGDNDGITFEGIGAVENIILEGSWLVDNDDITFDGLTFKGTMYIGSNRGDGLLIQNCVFEKLNDTGGDEILVQWDTPSADVGVIQDSTFDTTNETADDDIAIVSTSDGLTVSGNTFTVDEDDIAVGVDQDTTVENNTFTGSSGVGVGIDSPGIVTVDGNTFDGLDSAVNIDGGTVAIMGNTIANSTGDTYAGKYTPLPTGGGAIHVESGATEVLIVNNNISGTDADDGVEYAVHSNAAASTVFVVFNNITDNAMNVDAANALDATHNWWGDAAGPDSDSYTTAADTSPYLGASVTGAAADVTATLLDAETAAGVYVSGATGADIIGAASYSGNPQESIADAIAFYDVYATGVTTPTTTEVTVKFYAGDENSELYAWSAATDIWVEQTSAFSAYGGYVYATVFADILDGTPFVLVDVAPAPVIADINLTAPQPGSTDVRITNANFTWTSVADADSYVWVLSAMADLSSPIQRAFPLGTAYTYAGTLDYDTPYYWQVLASGAGEPVGESDVGTFTTAVEPVVPPALTYTCPQDGLVFTTPEALIEHWNLYHGPAAPTYTCPVDGLVFTTQDALAAHWNLYHAPAAEVTPAYIWVIIGVGAVLVIGVIVLIVRTRRVT